MSEQTTSTTLRLATDTSTQRREQTGTADMVKALERGGPAQLVYDRSLVSIPDPVYLRG
jgi:hypothetical protein